MVHKKNTNKNIISTTLKLAETIPWQKITIDGIAQAEKIESSALLEIYPSKLSILDAFNRQLDAEIIQEFASIEKLGSVRDQLFDILMARFDLLNRYKIAVKLIYKETVPFDPLASAYGLHSLIKSMKIVLNIAGIPTCTLLGFMKTKILSAIFMRSFIAWLGDDSTDMAKTMAILDSDLVKVENFSNAITNTCGYKRK
jgi:hypothetical protein